MTNSPVSLALVYNKDRTKTGQFETTRELADLMHGRPKVYFYAKYLPVTGDIQIEKEAPWQDW